MHKNIVNLSYYKTKFLYRRDNRRCKMKNCRSALEKFCVLWYTIMVYFLMKGGDHSGTDYNSRGNEGTAVLYEARLRCYAYV